MKTTNAFLFVFAAKSEDRFCEIVKSSRKHVLVDLRSSSVLPYANRASLSWSWAQRDPAADADKVGSCQPLDREIQDHTCTLDCCDLTPSSSVRSSKHSLVGRRQSSNRVPRRSWTFARVAAFTLCIGTTDPAMSLTLGNLPKRRLLADDEEAMTAAALAPVKAAAAPEERAMFKVGMGRPVGTSCSKIPNLSARGRSSVKFSLLDVEHLRKYRISAPPLPLLAAVRPLRRGKQASSEDSKPTTSRIQGGACNAHAARVSECAQAYGGTECEAAARSFAYVSAISH